MEFGRHFVSYIAVAVFILAFEHSDARPTTDSLYGDHVYSGAIYPISGAIPKKIHGHEKSNRHQKSSNVKTTPESSNVKNSPESSNVKTTPESNNVKTTPESRNVKTTPESSYVTTSPETSNMKTAPESSKETTIPQELKTQSNAQSTMESLHGNAPATMDSMYGNAQATMDSPHGNTQSMMDSLYGDHVISGVIYPISGAVPKKLPRHGKSSKSKTKEGKKAQKVKKIFDKSGTDLSQFDLSETCVTREYDDFAVAPYARD